jgi:hypothetical protein
LDERALEQMVLGVSTRRYARSLEPLPETIVVRGISKSAVSERFVYGTERKLAELMSRELRELNLVALMWNYPDSVDGVGGQGDGRTGDDSRRGRPATIRHAGRTEPG